MSFGRIPWCALLLSSVVIAQSPDAVQAPQPPTYSGVPADVPFANAERLRLAEVRASANLAAQPHSLHPFFRRRSRQRTADENVHSSLESFDPSIISE